MKFGRFIAIAIVILLAVIVGTTTAPEPVSATDVVLVSDTG